MEQIPKRLADGRQWLVVALILLAGAVLRFKGLTLSSYWSDELGSAFVSDPSHSFAEMWRESLADNTPPLYQALLWGWYKLFGFTELAGRALSALIGVAGVYCLYGLAAALFGWEAGVLAALVATGNIYLMLFSQEVRAYGLLFCLAALSYWQFVRVLERPTLGRGAAYALATLAALYTHYFALLLPGSQLLYLVWHLVRVEAAERRRLLRLAAPVTALLAAGMWPLVATIMQRLGLHDFWITRPRFDFLYSYLEGYVGGRLEFLLWFGLLVLGLFRLQWEESPRVRAGIVLLVAWVAVGYLVPYVRSLVSTPVLYPRYTIGTLPALLLLVTAGLTGLRSPQLKWGLAGALLVLQLQFLYEAEFYKPNKEEYRAVARSIIAEHQGEPIYGLRWNDVNYTAYFKLLGHPLTVLSEKELATAVTGGKLPERFWVVDGHNSALNSPLLQARGLTLVKRIDRQGASAGLFARAAPTPP